MNTENVQNALSKFCGPKVDKVLSQVFENDTRIVATNRQIMAIIDKSYYPELGSCGTLLDNYIDYEKFEYWVPYQSRYRVEISRLEILAPKFDMRVGFEGYPTTKLIAVNRKQDTIWIDATYLQAAYLLVSALEHDSVDLVLSNFRHQLHTMVQFFVPGAQIYIMPVDCKAPFDSDQYKVVGEIVLAPNEYAGSAIPIPGTTDEGFSYD